MEGDEILGRVNQSNHLFKTGSLIRFESDVINQVKGSRQWNIENLTVLVSEKIIYQWEQVGYFYAFEMEPWSYGRIFYARSELNEPKEGLPLLEIPLSTLVFYDPVIEHYLDAPALNGLLRTDDFTFKGLDLDFRNEKIFPLDYCGPNNVWDVNDISEDDSELPF